MKKLISAFLAASMALSLAACGSSGTSSTAGTASSNGTAASETITLKLGHQSATTVPEGEALQWFADEVNARTNGAVTIDIYPNEELGDAVTMVDMTKLGTCDMVLAAVGNVATYDSYFNIGAVPFLFKDNSIAAELNAGEIGQHEEASLQQNGLHIVNTARNFYRGPYRVLVSKKPVNSLDDIQGMRFRAYESQVYMNAWTALGANPIVIAWSETYSALQQGTVDAATSTIGQLNSVKFTEVAPYVTRINEYASEAVLIANSKKWNSLSAEQQQIITDAANEAGDKMSELLNASVQEDIDEMTAAGAIFSDIDTTPFREKLADFYRGLENDDTLPAGLVDKALNS